MSSGYAYRGDQELPSIQINWLDGTGATIDFSTGWTFTAKVVAATAPTTVLLTKTTGITGAASSPNVTIDWATTDFAGLAKSDSGTRYLIWLYARRAADSKDRVFDPSGASPLSFTLFTAPA